MSFAAATAEKISRLPSFDPSLYLTRIVVPSGVRHANFGVLPPSVFPGLAKSHDSGWPLSAASSPPTLLQRPAGMTISGVTSPGRTRSWRSPDTATAVVRRRGARTRSGCRSGRRHWWRGPVLRPLLARMPKGSWLTWSTTLHYRRRPYRPELERVWRGPNSKVRSVFTLDREPRVNPSVSNSPWIPRAPQRPFSEAMRARLGALRRSGARRTWPCKMAAAAPMSTIFLPHFLPVRDIGEGQLFASTGRVPAAGARWTPAAARPANRIG